MEKLCLSCRLEGLKICPIEIRMAELQLRVPKQVVSDEEFKFVGELVMEESEAHIAARERGCNKHNDYTLVLPRYSSLNLDE